MNIYSVKRHPDEEIDYDSYLGFVCVAATEDEARHMWPSTEWTATWDEEDEHWVDSFGDTVSSGTWTVHLDGLVVEHIGVTAVSDQPSGVVMDSFLAG